MEELLERCAGLDVHRDTVVACVIIGFGKRAVKETQTFGKMTDDLHALSRWLKQKEIKHIAMESTGVYWIPIFNILEEDFEVNLANPRRIKNVPGRKTDVNDAEWICKLLKNGLIEKSFIPPEAIRHLRGFTRYRNTLTNLLTGAKNRLKKTLEAANIKLATVFSDVFGKSAWRIIQALADGEQNLDELIAYVPRQVKASKEQIKKALKGTLKQPDLIMLRIMIKHITDLEHLIKEVEEQIQSHLLQYETEVELLKAIPGISDTAAAVIIAEIGTNMAQFPTEHHLTSWAGLAPGNHESAGKKKNARINKGNAYLKRVLLQVAWVAVKQKNTYWHAAFRALLARRGQKKALIAIGRKILVTIYHIITNKIFYKELGSSYIDEKLHSKRLKYHQKQLECLGYNVAISAKTEMPIAA